MSCNYYRVTPEPPRPEVYGFKRVSQEELGNIITRLTKPTYNSRVHTVEAHKAHNYRQIHSAPPPRSPTHCSRRRLSTPNPNTIIAAMTTTAATTTIGNAKTNDAPPVSPNPPAGLPADTPPDASNGTDVTDTNNYNAADKENRNTNDHGDPAAETLEDSKTASNNVSETATPIPPTPLLPLPPPDPPVPFAERKLTEKELKRFLRRIQRPTRAYVRSRKDYIPEEDDEIVAGDDYSTFNAVGRSRRPLTATERKKAFFLMSRPTTASRAKSSVDCVFCPEEEMKANRDLNLPFRYPHAPEEKLLRADEASSVVTRVSSPTRASLRGGGPPCYRSAPDYDSVRGQHTSLPLVSGLARTPTVAQIVNRLHYGTSRRRLVVVVREEEEEEGEGEWERTGSEQTGDEDRRGSYRGATSEDEAEKRRRSPACVARQHRKRQHNISKPTQHGRRGYHGYYTAATPITAWS